MSATFGIEIDATPLALKKRGTSVTQGALAKPRDPGLSDATPLVLKRRGTEVRWVRSRTQGALAKPRDPGLSDATLLVLKTGRLAKRIDCESMRIESY